jgi:hypothetical protein
MDLGAKKVLICKTNIRLVWLKKIFELESWRKIGKLSSTSLGEAKT